MTNFKSFSIPTTEAMVNNSTPTPTPAPDTATIPVPVSPTPTPAPASTDHIDVGANDDNQQGLAGSVPMTAAEHSKPPSTPAPVVEAAPAPSLEDEYNVEALDLTSTLHAFKCLLENKGWAEKMPIKLGQLARKDSVSADGFREVYKLFGKEASDDDIIGNYVPPTSEEKDGKVVSNAAKVYCASIARAGDGSRDLKFSIGNQSFIIPGKTELVSSGFALSLNSYFVFSHPEHGRMNLPLMLRWSKEATLDEKNSVGTRFLAANVSPLLAEGLQDNMTVEELSDGYSMVIERVETKTSKRTGNDYTLLHGFKMQRNLDTDKFESVGQAAPVFDFAPKGFWGEKYSTNSLYFEVDAKGKKVNIYPFVGSDVAWNERKVLKTFPFKPGKMSDLSVNKMYDVHSVIYSSYNGTLKLIVGVTPDGGEPEDAQLVKANKELQDRIMGNATDILKMVGISKGTKKEGLESLNQKFMSFKVLGHRPYNNTTNMVTDIQIIMPQAILKSADQELADLGFDLSL